jgi:hypothetical protein
LIWLHFYMNPLGTAISILYLVCLEYWFNGFNHVDPYFAGLEPLESLLSIDQSLLLHG